MNKPLLPISSPLGNDEASHNARRPEGLGRNLASIFQRILVFIAVLFVGYVVYYHFTRLPFDSAQWKASGSYEKLSVRERMCDDLQGSERLIGLNHAQVVALLGKPDQYHIRDWTMGYMVGYSMIDPVMLVIKFDENKKVYLYNVRTFQ